MKKTIMVLGYLFLALVAVLAAGIGIATVSGHFLDRESKAYVDAALPAIAAEWDISEIQKRASPEFEQAVDYDELAALFLTLEGLGPLEDYQGATGESTITLSFQHGYEITADYTANADFESGSAEIRILLIKHGNQWQILDLTITPARYVDSKDMV